MGGDTEYRIENIEYRILNGEAEIATLGCGSLRMTRGVNLGLGEGGGAPCSEARTPVPRASGSWAKATWGAEGEAARRPYAMPPAPRVIIIMQ